MEQFSQSGSDTAAQLALRVALQTMKERCIALQKRLNVVEEENQQLREGFSSRESQIKNNSHTTTGITDNLQMKQQFAELQRQKTQLTEHINMISNENRKLWSRLSQMTKERGSLNDPKPAAMQEEEPDAAATTSPRCLAAGAGAGTNQNLIRSKTFTQHSPNPNLRHKLISSDIVNDDISLDEVVLENAAYPATETKNTLVEYAEAAEAELGFAYLNVAEECATSTSSDPDLSAEAKKCIEGLQEMRREAMKQQQELNMALQAVERRMALRPCLECAKKSQKPEMADKSLETDDSLSEIKFNNISDSHKQNFSQTPQLYNGHNHSAVQSATESSTISNHLNIIQEKIAADELDKTCPMCGRIYSSSVTFDAFREHVETHFIDDSLSEVELSVERNFEMVSHAVGDF